MKYFSRARDGTASKRMLPITLAIFLAILFASFGYAALNTKLQVSGEAYVRVESDIRITDIRLISATNANETFQSNYSKNTITMGVNLNDTTSVMTYEYTVKNDTDEDYLITNIKELSNVNQNINYTNTAITKTVIPAHSSKTFQLSFTTTAQSQTTSLALQFIFALEEVTPPTITGGSNSWTASNQTITMKTAGTATSGVKHYEYYISDNLATPGENVTGTTTGNVTVSVEGTKYIFYRTVSNLGKKSAWSNYRITKVDKATPTITMLAAGSYDMSDSRDIATSTFGAGGGKTSCTNTTLGGSAFTKMSSINAFGKQTIKCTATGNNGKSASKTVTYTMYALMNGANMSCKTDAMTGNCTKSGTSLIVPAGYIQFGPYKKASKGCYKVTYDGSGFANNISYEAYQNNPAIGYTVLSKSVTSNRVTYYFKLDADATGSGIEVVIRNYTSGNVTIKTIKVEPVSTCPAS